MAAFALLLVALVAAGSASAPPPSLKHDTDVVRLARPSDPRRLLVVDVVQPPPPTPDPLLTNEVDTSADTDLPRVLRVLVPQQQDDYLPRTPADQSEDLDKASEDLTRLKPPPEDQEASILDWRDAAPAAPAAPAEDLVPPPSAEPDLTEWSKQPAERRTDAEEVKEPLEEPAANLQPPSPSAPVGLWELFSEVSKLAATAQPRADLPPAADLEAPAAAAEQAKGAAAVDSEVYEPAADLQPPPPGAADLTAWSRAAVEGRPQTIELPEPATHLVPPPLDSYSPEKPSSGEAGPDDFLSLGAAPPNKDAASSFEREHADSYLPEAGELQPEEPVAADLLKEDADESSTEKDSYVPDDATVSSSPTPVADAEVKAERSQEQDTHEHEHEYEHDASHEHVHDEVHATTPKALGEEGGDEVQDDEVDGDGVKMSISKDLRKKRHICKMCGGYGGGYGGGVPTISVVIQKQPHYGGGGGGGYCDVCGRPQPQPVYHQPVYKPVYKPVYVQQEPVCNSCNQPPPPPPPPAPCQTCGGGGYGGGGGGSQSYSQSSSSSQSSSYSSGWGKK